MLCDYHVHTHHSIDSRQTLSELCRAAQGQGLAEICLTEHYEPHHPQHKLGDPPIQKSLLLELDQARQEFPSLSILLGMEIGDNPPWHEEILAWLEDWPLDYRLLSLHLVDGVDAYTPEFFQRHGLNRGQAYQAYAQAVLDSIRSWQPKDYDALAHLGFVGKNAPFPMEQQPLRMNDAPETIESILRILAQSGKALEINTSRMDAWGEPIPDVHMIRRFHELGGEFVIFGSDAHGPGSVGRGVIPARALAQACGIRYTLRFVQRKAIPILID